MKLSQQTVDAIHLNKQKEFMFVEKDQLEAC